MTMRKFRKEDLFLNYVQKVNGNNVTQNSNKLIVLSPYIIIKRREETKNHTHLADLTQHIICFVNEDNDFFIMCI